MPKCRNSAQPPAAHFRKQSRSQLGPYLCLPRRAVVRRRFYIYCRAHQKHSGKRATPTFSNFRYRVMTDSEVIFDANRRKQLESTLIGKYPVIELCDMDGLEQMFSHNLSLYVWKSKHACKIPGTMYEMNMIHLARDCSVPLLQQVILNGRHLGFIMNLEK